MRGKRRLAYPIAKHREGIYVQLSHQGDGQHVFKIEKAMRLSEDVIRYMTVKQEGPLPSQGLQVRIHLNPKKDNPDANIESKEKQPVAIAENSTSDEVNTEPKKIQNLEC